MERRTVSVCWLIAVAMCACATPGGGDATGSGGRAGAGGGGGSQQATGTGSTTSAGNGGGGGGTTTWSCRAVTADADVQQALPKATVDTSYTAPSGKMIAVHAGDDLQAAIDQAQAGDAVV